jgi:hypothetical protein
MRSATARAPGSASRPSAARVVERQRPGVADPGAEAPAPRRGDVLRHEVEQRHVVAVGGEPRGVHAVPAADVDDAER